MNKYIRLFFFIFIALYQGKVLTNSYAVAVDQNPQYQSMRILFVINRFPWYTKSIIVNQLVGLLCRGHDVYLFAKTKMNNYKLDSALDIYNFSQRVYYEKLPDDLHTYDVIIFQSGALAKEFCGIKKKYGLKAKLVTFLRGSDITNKREASYRAYRKLFACGDLFLPVCAYFRRRLRALGCDPKKIVVHYSGIDCLKFCRIDQFTTIENSTLNDHVTVYANSLIKNSLIESHSHIGPYAHLHTQSHLTQYAEIYNFVKVKNSVI